MSTIKTTEIGPIDLNSLLYNLEMYLSELYGAINDSDKAKIYS